MSKFNDLAIHIAETPNRMGCLLIAPEEVAELARDIAALRGLPSAWSIRVPAFDLMREANAIVSVHTIEDIEMMLLAGGFLLRGVPVYVDEGAEYHG